MMGGERVTVSSDDGRMPAEPSPAPDSVTRAVIEARFVTIAGRFRDAWTAAQQDLVRTRIKQLLDVSDELHRTPMANHDEPEIVFVPYDGGGVANGTGAPSC